MMSSRQMQRMAIWVVMFLMGSGMGLAADYLSPLDIAATEDGRTLFIAQATASAVAVFDVDQAKVTRTIPLPMNPTALALSPAEARLYVVGGVADGKLCVIDLSDGLVKGLVSVGHSPSDVVVRPDGKLVYVCNQFTDDVAVVDLAEKKVTHAIKVARQPVAAEITSDGKWLLVANLLPAGRADADYSSAVVSLVDTQAAKTAKEITLPNGSMSARGICLSPDGKFAYVTHILARYQLPTTQLERGWMNTNAMSIIDVSQQTLVNTVLLDDVDLGAANPWGIACTPDGKEICVSLAGTHQIAVIDRAGMHEKLQQAAQGQRVSDATSSAEDVPNDLAFLVRLKKRINVTGKGPRGLAVVGRKAYVTEYFSDGLGVVDIDSKARRNAVSIALGPEKEITTVRKGEMFFHDAELCFQKWQSCSSCHPSDGRADALNWDLLNDGLGNPKNSKSMLLAHRTPPSMVSGVRGDAETAVRAGIRYIQFAVRPEEDAVAIDEYLKGLQPVVSPYRKDGKLSPAAQRGQDIFVRAGCVHCHPAPLFTNLQLYDVGLGLGREEGKKYDTPTLVEVWRTGPYLHDGRAVTMEEVLTKFNKDDKHGKTSDLTPQEIADLAEYVLSL
ncbi:MAG: c-type cytochrome [Sedimentisphaerales bacterium]|nr:c-type cytochrome [Sedimentisphaerales bacterium]